MKTPAISVIVPVYNVEKYLDRCVRSILNQTFSDFELILVDDGSPDNCGSMCDSYAKQDARVQVIHKKNGGLSDARNVGKAVATGEYILFVDSDDYIKEIALEDLYRLAKKNNADIVIGEICNCYEKYHDSEPITLTSSVCSGTEALKEALHGTVSICGKLISREMAAKHDFPIGRTSEDAFFTPALLLDVQVAVITNEMLYFYWHRSGSITTSCNPETVMDVVDAYLLVETLIENQCPELLPYAKFRVNWSYLTALDRLFQVQDYKKLPQYKKCKRYLKKNWLSIASCPLFTTARRISVVFLKINIYLYRLLVSSNEQKKGTFE